VDICFGFYTCIDLPIPMILTSFVIRLVEDLVQTSRV
jgi:hypothetical protein